MNEQPDQQPADYVKPIAYDVDGQPLYSHPEAEEPVTAPVVQPADTTRPAPTVVHIARQLDPIAMEIPPEMQAKHDGSVKAYPQLDLSRHEYVLLSVRRHVIGLIVPLIVTLIMTCLLVAGMLLLPDLLSLLGFTTVNYVIVYLLCFAALVLLWIGMYVLYWVYMNNTFFLTNESIIEKTQLTLFSSNLKSVGLGDVVDVSYRQTGIIEQLFNFGTVQVGTKDDKVPYVFNTVRSPKEQASVLKDAVEAFKNGRPIDSQGET